MCVSELTLLALYKYPPFAVEFPSRAFLSSFQTSELQADVWMRDARRAIPFQVGSPNLWMNHLKPLYFDILQGTYTKSTYARMRWVIYNYNLITYFFQFNVSQVDNHCQEKTFICGSFVGTLTLTPPPRVLIFLCSESSPGSSLVLLILFVLSVLIHRSGSNSLSLVCHAIRVWSHLASCIKLSVRFRWHLFNLICITHGDSASALGGHSR